MGAPLRMTMKSFNGSAKKIIAVLLAVDKLEVISVMTYDLLFVIAIARF